MKRFSLTILILFILTGISQAQSNYKPGYVVKSSGDTLRGYINYREWSSTPRTIEFRNDLNTHNTVRYSAATLQAFEVNGAEKYISYNGLISTDRNVFPDLPTSLDTTTRLDTIFMLVRYQGSLLSLLTHQDDTKLRFFVQENSRKPQELRFHQYYNNGGSTFRTVNAFYAVLLGLAQQYNSVNQKLVIKISHARFTESELIQILKLISKDDRSSQEGTYGSRFFAGILLNNIDTRFDGNNAFSGQSSVSYLPRLSAGMDFMPNKNVQRFFLRSELALSYIKPRFEANNTASENYDVKYQFDQLNIALIPQLLFNVYNSDALKIYLNGGVAFNYSIYMNNKSISANPYRPDVIDDYYIFHKIWMNFPLEIGTSIHKRFNFFALYSGRTAYTAYTAFSVSSRVLGIGFRYQFER
ncbi:hypothetical protein ABDD95_22335 [Mucilaginibacter sp. PAMB04274]|uniref:hypothetical protein n=1 Tax=Mucilaginibacter sp. PAMB04274 TaxID=3138568 RepID=UPI0031F6B2D0